MLIVVLGILGLLYWGLYRSDLLLEKATHIMFGLAFTGIGLLYTTVIPATLISSERESQSLPILLCTTLTTRQIIRGKWLGAMRQSVPVWLLLLGHLICFSQLGYLHWLALPLLFLSICGHVFFVIGLGLFLSSWYRKTTTAVLVNLLLAGLLWLVLPYMVGIFLAITQADMEVFEAIMSFNPLVHVVVIMEACAGFNGVSLQFDWPGGSTGLASITATLVFSSLLASAIGLLFAALASRNLRTRALHNL